MKTKLFFLLCGATVFAFSGPAVEVSQGATSAMAKTLAGLANKHASLAPKTRSFVIKALIPMIDNQVLAKAVAAQNAKGVSLAEIQAIDKKWIGAEEEMPIQKAVRANACAEEISKLAKKFPAIKEAFVMDNQGAVVCENALTSDYWQGDEAKWQKSFNGGKGGVDAGKVKFDKSANTNLQQVSLPIIDKAGKVIGAVTFGLNVDQV